MSLPAFAPVMAIFYELFGFTIIEVISKLR
jgi:hypothetical protein